MATPQPKLFRRRGTIVPPEVPRILTAAESNDVKALDLTLRYYAVNERDESGMTPLHYAAGTLANQATDQLLAHPDTDATIADDFGRSAATVDFECWEELSDAVSLRHLCVIPPHLT